MVEFNSEYVENILSSQRMFTPEVNKLIQSAAHTNGGIRKSLLTPCRRIGLSKVRKSSSNSSFTSPLESKDLNNTISSADNIEVNKITDSNKICINPGLDNNEKRIIHLEERNVNEIPNVKDTYVSLAFGNENKKKTNNIKENIDTENCKVLDIKTKHYKSNLTLTKDLCMKQRINTKGRYILDSEDEDDSTSSISNIKQLSKTCLKRKVCISDDENDTFTLINAEDSNEKLKNNSKIKTRKRIITSQNNDRTRKDNCSVLAITDDNISSQDDSENTSQKTSSQSSKGTDLNNQEGEENSNHLNESFMNNLLKSHNNYSPKVILNVFPKINENSLPSISKKFIRIDYQKIETPNQNENKNTELALIRTKLKEKTSRSVKRKLSLKKSTSKGSDLSQSNAFSNSASIEENDISDLVEMETTKIIDKIVELEKTVHDKEIRLQELQQAQIYRNLHKLEDLKLTTNDWKIGCETALRELLVKLNEHGPIDMDTLLLKLNAPSHLIKYDAESDSFL